jgi:hypothetical protein
MICNSKIGSHKETIVYAFASLPAIWMSVGVRTVKRVRETARISRFVSGFIVLTVSGYAQCLYADYQSECRHLTVADAMEDARTNIVMRFLSPEGLLRD